MNEPSFIALDQKKIKNLLQPSIINMDNKKLGAIEIFETIESTNEYLIKKINAESQVDICIAEAQTQGRGSFDRPWYSPYGENIYLSLSYPFRKKISELSGLDLIFGLAVSKAVESCYELSQQLLLKWPNDLKINDKKLAGNLDEIKIHSIGHCHVIMGVGININMIQASEEQINQPWTSIKKITGQAQDRNVLCAKLIKYLILYLQKFEKFGFGDFVQEWQARDSLFGKAVRVSENNIVYSGTAAGVDKQGCLILTLKNGEKKSFNSGEAFLLK